MTPAHHPINQGPDESLDYPGHDPAGGLDPSVSSRPRNPFLPPETTSDGLPVETSARPTPDSFSERERKKWASKLENSRRIKEKIYLKKGHIPGSSIPRRQDNVARSPVATGDTSSVRICQESEDAYINQENENRYVDEESEDANSADERAPTNPVRSCQESEDASSADEWAPQNPWRRRTDTAPTCFTRNNGIVYVDSDYRWGAQRTTPPDCHIFVCKPAKSTHASSTNQPSETTCGYEALPSRVKISNHFLRVHMGIICQFGPACSNYAAPFRLLVTLEEQFREALDKCEADFSRISLENPGHEAVVQDHYDLPIKASCFFGEGESHDLHPEANKIDHVTRLRITRDGFRNLVTLLDTDLAALVSTARRVRLGRIENDIPRLPFSHLWYLFPPGQVIYDRKDNDEQAYFVVNAVGGRRSLTPRHSSTRPVLTVSALLVDCFYLHFDGQDFRPVSRAFSIQPYEGTLSIIDLPVCPLMFYPKRVEDSLLERGMKLEGLMKPSHRMYHGYSAKEGDYFDTAEEVDSDVIVDLRRAYEDGDSRIRPPRFLDVNRDFSVEDSGETMGRQYDNPALLYAIQTDLTTHMDLLAPRRPGTLTTDGHLILTPRVYAYVLRSRKWLPLHIDFINDVPRVKPGVNDGFQKLVLPDGHKDIVRALVNTHDRRTTEMGDSRARTPKREFDVVKGKGQGLIILLHGAPGVGKTSTAECVAANSGRPLLPITCGDLGGASVSDVERNLEKYFDLARKWKCVLLLDEADVFLGAREKGDIHQIMLASVFLRVLEYYSGILILTTNRVGSFDEAIKSRVHCALYYPPLDDEQSIKIWRMNLDMLEENQKAPDSTLRVRFNRREIEDFAAGHWRDTPRDGRWNGRQIKNAFQTAIALADWDHLQQTGGIQHPDGPLLTQAHFKTVATASSHFDDYLTKVRGTDQLRAKASEARRDDIRDLARAKTTTARRFRGKKKVREPSSESSEDSDDEDSDMADRRKAGKSRSSKGKKKKATREESSGESEEPASEEDRTRRAKKSHKSKSRKKGKAPAHEPSDENGEGVSGTEEGASVDEGERASEEAEEKWPKKKKSSKKKSRDG